MAAIAGLPGAPAEAALVSCPASFVADGTAKVFNGGSSAASACEYITPPDPSTVANETTVNAAGFFGFSDWMITAADQVDVNASSGSWMITAVDFAAFDYMITFKDGANTNLVSFLLNEMFSSGSWTTPFTEPPFSFPGAATSRDVSHYSIFKRGAGTPVPEPLVVTLLGSGLLAIAAMGRRRAR
jgi:hypothetical protein